MIILDTNVVSEIVKPLPSETAGIELLPPGQRQRRLVVAFERIFGEFQGRVLPFDRNAAAAYAKIMAARERTGRRMSIADAMIAAIARSRGVAVATRNVPDFENCGISVINPWD